MSQLSGMKAICEYVKRSEPTVLDWIRNLGFPAKKMGGTWESDKDLVDKWRLKLMEGNKDGEKKKSKYAGRRQARGV